MHWKPQHLAAEVREGKVDRGLRTRFLRVANRVRDPPNAPRSVSSISARSSAFASGFSSHGKLKISSMPAALSVSTTSAKSSRFTSGNSCNGRFSCSRSVHNLTQTPGAVRPARPARWSADATEILSMSNVLIPRCGSYRAMRASPPSTTAVTPSIVSDVSATLVETIIFRVS